MTLLRPLVLLALDHARRLLREGIVLRSLIFPVALSVLAVGATVATVMWVQPTHALAVTADAAAPELIDQVEQAGFDVVVVDDPGVAVEDGRASVGTDGTTLWLGRGGQPPLQLEEPVRAWLGTRWRPEPRNPYRSRRRSSGDPAMQRMLGRFIGVLFAFYGVVFGAGAIARDKDEGTLDAELSMAIPSWVHGAARWLAGTAVLGVFYALSVALLHAVIGVPGAQTLAVHGVAAAAASTAIGIVVVGRSGLDRGFAGPMSAGIVVVVTLLSWGASGPELAHVIPIASLGADAPQASGAAAVSWLTGVVAAVSFARRTAVQ